MDFNPINLCKKIFCMSMSPCEYKSVSQNPTQNVICPEIEEEK